MLTVGLGVVVLYVARDVLIPVALAVLLTFLLAPLVRVLERIRFPRVLAVGVSMTLATAVVGSVAWMVEDQVVELATRLPEYKATILDKIESLRSSKNSVLTKAGETIAELRKAMDQPAPSEPAALPAGTPLDVLRPTATPTPPSNAPDAPVRVAVVEPPTSPLAYARAVLDAVLGPLEKSLVVLILTIFLLLKREDVRDRFIRLVGRRELSATTSALDDAGDRVSRYLIAQSVANLAAGGAISIGLLVLGVPSALFWGLLVALMRFLPYIGIWIAGALPVLLSLAVTPGWSQALLALAVIAAVEVVIGNAVEPILFGSRTGLSPLAVIAAAVFWAWLWGLIGLLVSIPLTVCVAVLGRHVPSLEFLDVLLGDEEALSPQTRLYQRLLADDADEAGAIIETFGRGKPLAAVFDGLLLPVLRMMEIDRHRGDPDRVAPVRDMLELLIDDAGDPATATAAPVIADADSQASGLVVCLPASDDADALSAMMLGRLLIAQGVEVRVLSAELLLGEMIEQIGQLKPQVVVVSALPPRAIVQARAMCKRIAARYPQLRVMVGIWDERAPIDTVRERLKVTGHVTVVTTMAEGANHARSLGAQGALVAAEPSAGRS